MDACDLQIGDVLLDFSGNTQEAISISVEEAEVPTYNFHVADCYCCAVGRTGLLVHNNSDNIKVLKDNYLKLHEIDAEAVKQEFLGRGVPGSHYNIAVNTADDLMHLIPNDGGPPVPMGMTWEVFLQVYGGLLGK